MSDGSRVELRSARAIKDVWDRLEMVYPVGGDRSRWTPTADSYRSIERKAGRYRAQGSSASGRELVDLQLTYTSKGRGMGAGVVFDADLVHENGATTLVGDVQPARIQQLTAAAIGAAGALVVVGSVIALILGSVFLGLLLLVIGATGTLNGFVNLVMTPRKLAEVVVRDCEDALGVRDHPSPERGLG